MFWPRLVDRLVPEDLSKHRRSRVKPGQVPAWRSIQAAHFQRMRSVMRDDVLDNEGTGKAARVADFAVCGKPAPRRIRNTAARDKVTWFASFALSQAPRYGDCRGRKRRVRRWDLRPVARQITSFSTTVNGPRIGLAANLP